MKSVFRNLCSTQRVCSTFAFPSVFALVVASFLVVFPNTVRPAAADDEAQLEVIRDGYVQAFTSIRNVWCRYEIRREPAEPTRKLFGPRMRICEWAMEGEKFHHSSIARTEEGAHYIPFWISTDGKDFWNLEYTERDEIDHAVKKQLRDGTWQMRGRISPGQFLGLYLNVGKHNTRGLTLQSILETVPLEFGGTETIDGHRCLRVDFHYPGESAVYEIPMTVFFDPATNYLPRRLIQYSTSGGNPTILTVLKFSQVKDGEGQSVYFPVEMRDDHPVALSRIKVQEVKLNEKLPEKLYRPRIPAGVAVYNVDNARDVEALRRKRSEAERP